MSVREGTHNEQALIAPEGAMTIYKARELKESLLLALKKAPGDITMDLSGVTDIDLAGLQLLLMLKQEAQRDGKSCVFRGHGPVIGAIAALLQMDAMLDMPSKAKEG